MLLQIEHSLHFSYSDYIRESHMDIRVEPRTQSGQVLLDFSLIVGPATVVTRHEDWLGNTVHWFSITDYHDRIEVLVRSLVETNPSMIPPGSSRTRSRRNRPEWPSGISCSSWSGHRQRGDAFASFGSQDRRSRKHRRGRRVAGEGLRAKFEYRPNVTDAHSTTDALLLGGGGVCQDFAHAALGLLRLSGIPARYVSGYLHVERDDDTPSQSQAWIEYWSPSHGWQPYDPTHGLVPNDAYVTVGYGRSYDDVPPNRGICQGGAQEMLQAEVVTSPGTRPDRRPCPMNCSWISPSTRKPPDRPSRTDLPGRTPLPSSSSNSKTLARSRRTINWNRDLVVVMVWSIVFEFDAGDPFNDAHHVQCQPHDQQEQRQRPYEEQYLADNRKRPLRQNHDRDEAPRRPRVMSAGTVPRDDREWTGFSGVLHDQFFLAFTLAGGR